MTAAAFTLILAALAVTAWAYVDARHDARQAHDAHTFEALDHERTRQELARTRAALARETAALEQAGHEAATHANHLEALLDATSEKPLTLVRGGRR